MFAKKLQYFASTAFSVQMKGKSARHDANQKRFKIKNKSVVDVVVVVKATITIILHTFNGKNAHIEDSLF